MLSVVMQSVAFSYCYAKYNYDEYRGTFPGLMYEGKATS